LAAHGTEVSHVTGFPAEIPDILEDNLVAPNR
jgi:hypothetical protein